MSVSGMGAWQDDHLIQRTFGAGVPTSELWEAPDSEMVMLGSRVLGVGQEMDTAAQPFRFRQWMFCAVGELDRSPDVRERLQNLGTDPKSSSPEEFDRFIRSQIERLGKVIKAASIKSE
jgi:hypothetical protein